MSLDLMYGNKRNIFQVCEKKNTIACNALLYILTIFKQWYIANA